MHHGKVVAINSSLKIKHFLVEKVIIILYTIY